MNIRTFGLFAAVLMVTVVLGAGSFIYPTAAQNASDADVHTIAAALDANGNQVLDDAEIRQAITLWVGGGKVAATGLTISDAVILKLIQFWITGQTIETSPTGSFRIDSVFAFDMNSEGELIVAGSLLQTAPAGSLITITGSNFPADPVAHTMGIQTIVIAQTEDALVTSVPVFSRSSETADIVISDKNNSTVSAKSTITIAPLDLASVVDPASTILDFLSAARNVTAGQGGAEAAALRQELNRLEDAMPRMAAGESRSIAATIIASDALTLFGKFGETQQTTTNSQIHPFQPSAFVGSPLFFLLLSGAAIGSGAGIAAADDDDDWPAITKMNSPLSVSFDVISSPDPVEGELQSIACLATDDDTIGKMLVGLLAEQDVFLVNADGTPTTEIWLEEQFDGSRVGEALTIFWNSKVTGQEREVVFECTAQDKPAFQASEHDTITTRLRIRPASTPEPEPKDTAPTIVGIEAPATIQRDSVLNEIVFEFADPNGDVKELRVRQLEGPNTAKPPQTSALDVAGQKTGTFSFFVLCDDPNPNAYVVSNEAVLIDSQGLESEPKIFTFTCEAIEAPEPAQNVAPTIVDIDAPGRFPGDGVAHDVTVSFTDQNGDIAQLRIEVTEGPSAGDPPTVLTLNVAGMITGEINLSINCTNSGTESFNVTQRLVLIDAEGLESAPKSHAYTCEPTG